MTPREYAYRNTVNLIACAMLIFCGAFMAIGTLLAFLPTVLTLLPDPTLQEILYQVIYALLYAAAFVAPVIFFCLVRRRVRPPEAMYLRFKMGKNSIFYLFVGLAVINAAAMLNASIIEIFSFSSASTEELFGAATSNLELVLQFMVIAVVPAFVEELLFRGVVLSNLMPFGKTAAVLGSALLFGVMHQNLAQLLYATVAGLVLGYIYVATRSIWPCVMLHFANNALSVLQGALVERLPEEEAMAIYTVMQVVIYALGILFAVLLFLRHGRRSEEDVQEEVPASEGGAGNEPLDGIPLKRRIRLFFSPMMIAFFAVALVQALLTLALLSLM